jgi:hypothetical protein
MENELKIGYEEKLLLALCRLEFTDKNLNTIRSLTSLVRDWYYLRSLANSHGVAALVWHNLEKHDLLSGIPEEVVVYLRSTLMLSLSRNEFNTEAMSEVLRILNKENIKTVILKGLALENSVYGASGLRQMSDVDILINRDKCIRARDILISKGFVSLPVKSFFHESLMSYFGKHLPSLLKNGMSVEIHHELFGESNNALTNILYDSSYEVEIKGERAWIPQPQIFFLYLIKHLWQHEINNESQLRLYTDLVVLIEKHYEEILNSDLLKYASGIEMSEMLASHLELLRDFWGISFPGVINNFIEIWHTTDTIDKFVFFLGSPKNNPSLEKPETYRKLIRAMPGFHRKFLYVLGDVFPSFTFMKKRYNCRSNWRVLLYYPHRVGKVLWLMIPISYSKEK